MTTGRNENGKSSSTSTSTSTTTTNKMKQNKDANSPLVVMDECLESFICQLLLSSDTSLPLMENNHHTATTAAVDQSVVKPKKTTTRDRHVMFAAAEEASCSTLATTTTTTEDYSMMETTTTTTTTTTAPPQREMPNHNDKVGIVIAPDQTQHDEEIQHARLVGNKNNNKKKKSHKALLLFPVWLLFVCMGLALSIAIITAAVTGMWMLPPQALSDNIVAAEDKTVGLVMVSPVLSSLWNPSAQVDNGYVELLSPPPPLFSLIETKPDEIASRATSGGLWLFASSSSSEQEHTNDDDCTAKEEETPQQQQQLFSLVKMVNHMHQVLGPDLVYLV